MKIGKLWMGAEWLGLLVLVSCQPGGKDESIFQVTASASYLPADGVSCLPITIAELEGPGRWSAPELTTNRGRLENVSGSGGAWSAELCAGETVGKVEFRSGDGRLVSPPLLYLVPPAAEMYPSPALAVTRFELWVDPISQNVTLTTADLSDADSIALHVFLNPSPPFLFNLRDVTIGMLIEGSTVGRDLMEVRAEIDEISLPGVAVTNPDGHDPEFGNAPYFSYGDFPATARAILLEGSPALWGAPWIVHFPFNQMFVIRGTVRVRRPGDALAGADFRIRPFLTRTTAGAVTVSWETDNESPSFVVYGPTPACEFIASGVIERSRIFEDYTFDFAPYFSSFFHRVVLTGLAADATYYYRVITVHPAPPPEPFAGPVSPGRPFSFGVISDTQIYNEAHAADISQMAQQPINFFLHAGDLVDAASRESLWMTFFAIEGPLLKNRPICPAVGNHDQGSFNQFYLRYFAPASPYPDQPALNGHMYSFDYGNSHFVSIDTNIEVDPASPQYLWLEQDLIAAQNNPDRKFTFVVEHFPVWSAFPHGQFLTLRGYLAPLYQAHDVDAVFAGHAHLYERSNVLGRPYLVQGGGGGALMFESPYLPDNPYYVTSLIDFHFTRVDVSADSFDIYAFTSDGLLFDQVHYDKP